MVVYGSNIENVLRYDAVKKYSLPVKRFELTDDVEERIEMYRQIVSLIETTILPKFTV